MTAGRFTEARRSWALVFAALAACGPGATTGPGAHAMPKSALLSMPEGSIGRIEVRQIDARPRLTLLSRDGDPSPAVVVAVATDVGPVATTALAALIEARLRSAEFDVDTRVDRGALRVRWMVPDASRVTAFLGAVAGALHQPIVGGAKELTLVAERLQALKRNPLDAPELVPIAACTGMLGITSSDAPLDLTTPGGVRDLEAFRRITMVASRTSVAAVGPAAFCVAAARALEQTAGWDDGPPATDALPASDSLAVYAAPDLARGGARVSVAVRVGDPHAAVAAAERIGAPGSALFARLAALPGAWRAADVVGAARPRGGCVAVTLEPADGGDDRAIERTAATVAAIARHEIRTELAGPTDPSVAARQILGAADPREAASRAAWWALAGSIAGSHQRVAIALGVSPGAERAPPGTAKLEQSRRQFVEELERAGSASLAPVAERRVTVERGQGELWLLLASPCGVADEGAQDAGVSALAVVGATLAHRADRRSGAGGVAIEPWVTADGVGIIAHGALASPAEAPAELARRVGDAAGRVLSATNVSSEALTAARTATLEHLERSAGRSGAALEIFAGAIAPDRPAWVEPFGIWSRVAGAGLESVRLRLQAIAAGPLRVAVIANADAAQGAAATAAVDRWLYPRPSGAQCPSVAAPASRPGRYDARLPRDAVVAQALIGAPVPTGAAGRDLAELTAVSLTGNDGLLAAALRGVPAAGRASARVAGGSRTPALVIDVRAPSDAIGGAITEVKALLDRLGHGGATEADLTRAAASLARRERDARSEPRRRLADVWAGRVATSPARPTLIAWRDFMAAALREPALVVVEARPE